MTSLPADPWSKEHQAAAERFFEMTLDHVCVAGFDGYFKRVNPAWTKTLGWTREELLAQPIVEFVHPDDRPNVLADRGRLMDGQAVGPIINRYRCKDGSYRWFEWRSSADVDRQRVYAVARDITDRQQSQIELEEAKAREAALKRQLIFADRMASVGTLAAGVAHEINNPLAYVIGNLSVMVEWLNRLGHKEIQTHWDEFSAMAHDAMKGASQIREIVDGLRAFSRTEEQTLAITDLLPLLDGAIDLTASEFRHRAHLVKDYQPIPLVEADHARLRQVFVNLLINASQAYPETSATTQPIHLRTGTDPDGRAIITVEDQGCGIAENDLERIFEPFFTTKPIGVGTGLGLYICRNIITGLGGDLRVRSSRGKGTIVDVILPAMAPVLSVPQSRPLPKNGEAPRAALLVVDSDPNLGRVLKHLLFDHDITAVTNARDAEEHLEFGAPTDIILANPMISQMSAQDFYQSLTKHFQDAVARLVFITDDAPPPRSQAFLDQVQHPVLNKPFTEYKLRRIIQRVLASSSQ